MSKTSEFRKYIDRSAHLCLSVAAFFVCMLSYVPLAAAQGAHVTAMGQQTMDRFLCDLPYVVSLPVTLLLAAILAVCAVRGKGQRPLVYYVVVFLLVFMLWMVSSSQLLAAKLAGTVALYRVANFFLYLVPAAANLVVLGALEEKYRTGQRVVVFAYVVFAVLATGADLFGVSGVSLRQQMYYALLLVLEAYVAYLIYRSARVGNRYSRAMVLPLIAMVTLGAFDGVNAHLHLTPLPTYIMPLSVYSFLYFILQMIRDQLVRSQFLESRTLELGYRAALLQERAERDPLTQCRNRGSFERDLPSVIWTARSAGTPLSLLLFDIDHFKQFNDTFGHVAGDMILRGFARTVRAELDKQKSFYRWGGEEFVVLLPGCDLDAAAVIGNRLRRTVAAFLQYEKHPVTVSVGVSVCHGGDDTAQALFERADSALYAAKAAGRNCLRVESPQAAIGEEALG